MYNLEFYLVFELKKTKINILLQNILHVFRFQFSIILLIVLHWILNSEFKRLHSVLKMIKGIPILEIFFVHIILL